MGTLKTLIIAASLLFAMSATAAVYPQEMPDIQNALIRVICKTPSLLFFKLYHNPEKEWQVLIIGRDKKEILTEIISEGEENLFAFIPATGVWENIRSIEENADKELEKFFAASTKEEIHELQSCIEFNLRSRRLLQ